jgi:hypothetical protein
LLSRPETSSLVLGDRHGALRRRGPVRSVDPPGDGGPDEREDRRRLIAVPEGKRVTCISGWPKDFEIELID